MIEISSICCPGADAAEKEHVPCVWLQCLWSAAVGVVTGQSRWGSWPSTPCRMSSIWMTTVWVVLHCRMNRIPKLKDHNLEFHNGEIRGLKEHSQTMSKYMPLQVEAGSLTNMHTCLYAIHDTHTHSYMVLWSCAYVYACLCVCVCMYVNVCRVSTKSVWKCQL